MGALVQDLHYALRMLRKSPGFTATVVLTLALGIGVNTAVFSIVNGVLLNPLPYPQPDRLVTLHESKPNFEAGSISYLNFRDWREQNTTFSSMAVTRSYAFSMTGNGKAEQVRGEFTSSDFFHLLSVEPVIGRNFAPREDEIGADPVALISAGLWNRKFGRSPSVLGKSINLDGKAYTIVGVIPASFDLLAPSFRPSDVYVPITQWTNPLLLSSRSAGLGIHGFGRLKPGVTIAQARADMERVTRNLAATYPDADKGIGATVRMLEDDMVGKVRPTLWLLLGAVGFVLLIACVNMANLLLARLTGRQREFAVRAALGAGRARVIGQLLTESVLLAVLGGGFGLLVASWGTRAALSVLPAALPRAQEIGLDARVLVFTLAISLGAGIFFSLIPALRTSRMSLNDGLKQAGRGLSGVRHRTQGVFVVVELAMALVLLIGAGLLTRSMAQLWSVNPGFDSRNVLTFGLSLPPSMVKAAPDAIRAAFRQLDDKFAATPGVRAVSVSWGATPMGSDDEELFWLDGQPKPSSDNDMNWALSYVVEPDYLRAMGIPLERGRFFTSHDDEHAPAVAVVDDVFARKFFPGENAIGKRIHLVNSGGQMAEIVGVVGHVKQWGLDRDDTQKLRTQLYRPFMQLPDAAMVLSPSGIGVVVRYEGSTAAVASAIRRSSEQMSPEQVIFSVESMNEVIADSLIARRFSMILFGFFAALALVLASVGIYGVISFFVGQHTHEIGVRLALGARPVDILRQVLGRGGILTGIGIGAGFVVALALTRLLAGMLYGVSATDPLTFVGVAALLILVALAACYLPARRATRVDPMIALRSE